MKHPVVLLTGPTASGKSAIAMALAHRLEEEGGATIINADSMQVYRELRVVTARPTPADETGVPHRLYGTLPSATPWSAAAFCDAALKEIAAAQANGRVAVVVGGTGLYMRALIDGLPRIPTIPDDIRAESRRMMDEIGPDAVHKRLADRDPETAATLRPNDPQRLARAWEVLAATGRPLVEWQRDPPVGGLGPERCVRCVVAMPRETLYARIDRRFAAMIDEGALGEVDALLDLGLSPALPAMRAVGVPQIAAFLRGEVDRTALIARGSQATRNLAKRQMTWARNQMSDWAHLAQDSENSVNRIFAKIRQ